MPTKVVVGAQWGDEGKGKIVDLLTEKADLIARYQGGNNAGHTVWINAEKYILNMIPSGILHYGKTCVIGNGVVIDPAGLCAEIDGLTTRGVKIEGNLFIAKNAHVIMPYHIEIDKALELRLGDKMIGTTLKGTGPCYTDKVARRGIRIMDLLTPNIFREKLAENLHYYNFLLEKLYNMPLLDKKIIYDEYISYAERLKSYIVDTESLIGNAVEAGKNVLFEAAQGTLLDIDHGTYPYVTSSNTISGGVCAGIGIGPNRINSVLGVSKAYTTRVGGGPFPTEMKDSTGEYIRERGAEYGDVTTRPRRCGWLDAVGLRYAVRVNGLTGIALTKLDVLDDLDSIKICTGYKYKGKLYKDFPNELEILANAEPVYEEMEGWKESTAFAKVFEQLPQNAQKYIRRIEELLQIKVQIISVGQMNDDVFILKEPFSEV
jgi:adenylosuccinate synthase